MKSFFKSLPLRIHTKISILAVLLVLFLVSSRSIVTLRAERKRVRRESEERAAILTRVLSVMMLQALREGDFSRLISTVKILVEEENSDIVRMRITKISETTGKEIEITDAQNPRFSNRDRQTFSPEKPQEIKGPSGVSGYIYTEFSLERFHAEMSVMRNQALVILGVFLVLGILGSILLSRLITKPIEQFEQAAQVIARGDLSAEVNYSSQDELGRLARSFNEMILGLKQIEKARIYLSHSAWMEVQRSSGTNLYLGGEARDVTVMFADVCGFTTLSEQLPPKEVVSVLNEYFGVIVDTIVKHKGVLDKFMGDCAMAVFYSPSLEESARNAVLCALEIQDNMAELERNRVFYQKTTVNVGIGINSGRVVSGNIGSSRRMEYTVIGDTVNIASRLEKLSKKGRHTRIIVGQKTHDFLEDLIEFVELPSTTLKGKKELLSIYEVRKLRELDDLLTNIKSEDPSLKQNSIKVLGRSNNPEAIPYLLELLLDNDPSIRMAVTVALSRLLYFPLNTVTRSRVKDAIVHAAETETDTKVLATLIQAIGYVGDSQTQDLLSTFLEHSDDRVRANAVEALLGVGAPNLVELVRPLIDDINNRVKANAAVVLWRSGDFRVIDALSKMLDNPRMLMRSSAVYALGELGTVRSMEMLIGVLREENKTIFFNILQSLRKTVDTLISSLHDPDREVKMQAIKALGKIGDRNALLPLMKMIDDADSLMAEAIFEAVERIGVPKEMILLVDKFQSKRHQA